MKNSRKRRIMSLLLALVMVLTLAPAARMEGNTDTNPPSAETPDPPGTSDPADPSVVTSIRLSGQTLDSTNNTLRLEPNSSANQGERIEVALEPDTQETRALHVSWTPVNSDVVGLTEQDDGHTAYLYGKAPGEETVTITAGSNRMMSTIEVTVSGIKASEELLAGLEIPENDSVTIVAGEDFQLFGDAAGDGATFDAREVNDKSNVMLLPNASMKTLLIQGVREGTATVRLEVSANGHTYQIEFPVTVTSNEATIPWTAGVSPTAPLKFSALESLIAQKCTEMTGEALASIVGLSVPPEQGIIYDGYKSPDDTGSGAGSGITYYASSSTRGPYISDLTFVPNADFKGEKAVITFTANAANNRTFKGRVEVTLTDAKGEDVKMTTRTDVPLKLKAEDFVKVCQEQTGGALDYVIFTQPAATQGVLYRDYKSAIDYGSRVTASDRCDRKTLDNITFVPAQGYVGPVTIGYAGYSTTGLKYSGVLTITVERPLDEAIQYQDYGAGYITFNGGDFDAYSQSMTRARMSYVSFTPPPASQGVLYRGRAVAGGAVTEGEQFSQTALNYVTFVAVDGFNGVVRIPFTGKDWNGADFSGTVELHIQAPTASSRGDITYTCQPGQSVKLQLADFANLCQSTTGQRLYYVTFQSLPDYTQGSLFYNRTSSGVIGTRVTTATKYFNSAAPYLNNVSFWAGQNFRNAEIPFTAAAVTGETFTGLLVISSGEGAGGGRAGSVTYATAGQQPVTFNGQDFDAACRQATNAALNNLRLSLPGSGQGILYYDYREGASPRAFDPNTTLYLTGEVSVNKVTFVPAKGFTGVAYIPFTATSINGSSYQGTVEVTVRAGAAYGSIVHYSTGGAPVRFQSYDLSAASGVGQPSSIRFTGMPSASQGRVYYQYTSPTQYSWLGNTTTSYSVTGDPSVSNLTFIPKAGYEGVVTIPYAVTGYDGTASTGTIEITVAPPSVSENFDDMADCSAQTRGAVDYLSSQGVVNGTAYRVYSPGMSIRRGDFCLMLSRAFQFNVGGTGRGFDDVPAGAYYAQAVNEMYALGVVNGVGGGKFQPESTITRQDAAVMVRRALDRAQLALPDGSDQAALANYQDRNQVDGYAQAALGSLVRAGIFPVSGNRLSPKTAITRADMALLLHRAMTNFS